MTRNYPFDGLMFKKVLKLHTVGIYHAQNAISFNSTHHESVIQGLTTSARY